jgi:hypothetical protein
MRSKMCDLDALAAKLRESDELQLRIIRDLGTFTVALLAFSKTKDGERLHLTGTGTLVMIAGAYYILTASHVWHKGLKHADKVGITLIENRDHAFFMDLKSMVPLSLPIDEKWTDWGPDLILLPVPAEYLGSINARQLFYSTTVDEKATLNSPHIEVWVLMGAPGVLGKHTQTYSEFEIRGFFVSTDLPLEVRGDYDYRDILIDTSIPGCPQDFGGCSGGGLWKVLISCECSTDQIDWVRSLQGVAFYQLKGPVGHRIVRCHGPSSIQTVMALVSPPARP